ncbi:MAG: RCC1 domain-containing protein [Polyangiales bacterium]
MLLLFVGGCVQELPTLGPGDASLDAAAPDAGVMDAGTDIPLVDASVPPLGRTLAAGTDHTCIVVEGQLLCFGSNALGQLGREGSDLLTPTLVEADRRWIEVTAGERFGCGLITGGEVLCWGDNRDGQLGDGTFNTRRAPATTGLNVDRVRAGYHGVCGVTESGEAYCWGRNSEGQIGIGSSGGAPPPEPAPVLVSSQDWTDVDLSQGHACALSGTDLYCWGRNTQGQLGLGAGAVEQVRTPTLAQEGSYQRVVVGPVNGCALDEAGALYCWGSNTAGQLGTGTGMDALVPTLVDARRFIDVDIDTFHACAITGGELYCWGRNAEGQLGLGDLLTRTTPARVGEFTDWVEVAVGRFHTCAKRSNGSVWCTGENEDGRLGVGDTGRRNDFTEVVLPGPG